MQVLGPVVSVVCYDVGSPRMHSERGPLPTDRIEREQIPNYGVASS